MSRHRVGRVLSVSPVVGIGTPPPPPLVRGGGHTRLRLKGWGSPNSNEGTYTVVLYIYKYFVCQGKSARHLPRHVNVITVLAKCKWQEGVRDMSSLYFTLFKE
jgi:hypothetical protein